MRAPGVRAVELAHEAEEKAQDVLDEWLAPLKSEMDRLMELAEAGSDDVFLFELEGLLAKADASGESLTNSDSLIESLWGLQADAFREGWEWYDRDDIAGARDDCRAKDPDKCRFHGQVGKMGDATSLGLEPLSRIKPDPASNHSNTGRAKKALERGFTARSIDGQDIVFGRDVLDHWDSSVSAKSESEKRRRLYKLSEAVRAVKKPHEIWELHNGQKTYLRVYRDKDGRFAMTGFVTGKNGRVQSFFHNRRLPSMEKTRKGTLIYKR